MSQTTQTLPATETTVITAKMQFMEIHEFKQHIKADKIEIVRNPHTNKLFANALGMNYKVEQAIDFKQPLRFMYETMELIPEGCIVNVKSENTVATL